MTEEYRIDGGDSPADVLREIIEEMRRRLITYMRMPLMAPLIKDYVSEHGTIAEWPEEIVRECFDLCVATRRGQ